MIEKHTKVSPNNIALINIAVLYLDITNVDPVKPEPLDKIGVARPPPPLWAILGSHPMPTSCLKIAPS